MNKRALLLAAVVAAAAMGFALDIDTTSLDLWEPLTFEKIPEHSTFVAVQEDGTAAIRIDSDASASAMIYTETFRLSETPILEWSWKVENVFEAGDATRKKGDDYPIRIYVLFEYSPERVPFLQRAQFELAKALYGEYPPAEVLNYVWANRSHDTDLLPNAYTGRAMMYFRDEGEQFVGQWRDHRVDILRDFTRAFDRDPPDEFTIAIMGDSDNTGESSRAYIRGISVKER